MGFRGKGIGLRAPNRCCLYTVRGRGFGFGRVRGLGLQQPHNS